MLGARLNQLRARLDGLRSGRIDDPGRVERARALFGLPEALPALAELERLNRELDRVGVHTAADARLLRQLGASKGRAGALAQGLADRARKVVEEYEERLRLAERAMAAGSPIRGATSQLERAFPPLARAVRVAEIFEGGERGEQRFEIFQRGGGAGEAPPSSALVEIARYWADRARENTADLFQKRRDLDSAHELLLRLGAGKDRDQLHALRVEVSDARARVHGLPAVRSLEDLVRHVRIAARKEPSVAYRSLRALYERAVEANDAGLAEVAHTAAAAMLPDGSKLANLVDRAERDALGVLEPTAAPETAGTEDLLAQLAFDLDDQKLELFELAAGCARYFDVEDSLRESVVEAEVVERKPVARRVPFPTQRMSYELTGSLHEVNNFVLSDPRTLVYDLASNRQLVRAYLDDEPPRKPKGVKKTAVRVYVCDASGSMHGPRARFRDAILIAELNNLRHKALRGLPVDPLYFSFFSDRPTTLARVDSAAEATRQIEKLFGDSPAHGQTQITTALVTAFDAIRAAQGRDPYLARATVVLITDGEDRIDLELIRATRAPVGALDISLSFISLGEENPDLRGLSLEQRQRGGRAFYHHLTDTEISAARTDFDSKWRTLLPREAPVSAEVLERLLPHLEALEQIARQEAPAAPRQTVAFDAVFPPVPDVPPGSPPPKLEPAVATRAAEILDAISEAAALAPMEQRASEAVTLLHHLLTVYGVTVPAYLEAVREPRGALKQNLERLRLVCRPFG